MPWQPRSENTAILFYNKLPDTKALLTIMLSGQKTAEPLSTTSKANFLEQRTNKKNRKDVHPIQDIPKFAATQKGAAHRDIRRQVDDTALPQPKSKQKPSERSAQESKSPCDHQNPLPRWAMVCEVFLGAAVRTDPEHEAARAFCTPCLMGSTTRKEILLQIQPVLVRDQASTPNLLVVLSELRWRREEWRVKDLGKRLCAPRIIPQNQELGMFWRCLNILTYTHIRFSKSFNQ